MENNSDERIDSKLLEEIERVLFNNNIDPQKAREVLQSVFVMKRALSAPANTNYKINSLARNEQTSIEKRMERSWDSLRKYVKGGVYSQQQAEMIFEKMYNQKPYKP